MLAVAKTPHIEVRVSGKLGSDWLTFLKKKLGSALVITGVSEDNYVDYFETETAKRLEKLVTPEFCMRTYRENKNLTQEKLGEFLGVSRAYVCDMEKGRKAISKEMAKKLSKLFKVPIDRFIA